MASIPVINFPTTAPGFSTNLISQTIKGTTASDTKSNLVNGSDSGVTYSSGDVQWTFVTMLEEGDNVFNVVAVDSGDTQSAAATITISYTTIDNLNVILSPPTGITLERGKNFVKISILENPEPEVIGYNFYGSENAGGGTDGFTLLNSELITESDFFTENTVVLSETVTTSGDIRTTNIIEQTSKDYYFAYTHNRIEQVLGTKPITEANHYVVTAVGFDNTLQQQVESSYSAELGAAPILLDTSIRDLPGRTTVDVQESYIQEILETDDSIDVKPGTVTRDIHINPPSDEFERLYIIQDFMHRSQSFLTLLEFDDPNGDDESDDILTTPNKLRLKEALLVPDENVDEVQQLIDDAFTKLAGNVNVTRKDEQQSVGQVLFYTKKTPTSDSTISAGGIVETVSDETTEAVQYSVLTDFTLRLTDLENYYNSTTNRYEITLDIQAIEAGSQGNVDADKIRLVVGGIDPIFEVTNPNPTEFGQDIESNASLAQRAQLAFVSVDAGTEAGYLATTLGTPNVERAKIISAGETLMQRDMDPLRLVHTYGKVDIYVQGSLQTTYTNTFGFTFATEKDERALIQSVPFFHFRTTNDNVTVSKPIYSVIEVKNVTKSANYDITGFEIIGDGNVIDLDESLTANQSIGLDPTDVIQISYRYRDSDPYIFENQPVEAIMTVEGTESEILAEENYVLQKLEDPLSFGNSTSAQDQMSLVYSASNGLPLGNMTEITNESHILTGENEVELSLYGVDTDTIVVTDSVGLTTYIKDTDYIIDPGDMKTKTTIKRITTGAISSGSTVFVSYEAGENFNVTYAVNTLLQSVQARVDNMRHLTADVVIKGAIKTYIDFDMTVVLEQGTDQTSVDRKIRTAIAKLLADKQIGESVYQSDVIHTIENISGVVYVVVPFTKMVKASGSQVVREEMNTDWTAYQTINVTTYKSNRALSWTTSEGGGPDTAFRGVFENDIQTTLTDDLDSVAELAGRSYISSDGYVYISPALGNISDADISITYIVGNASGARDILFSDIEYGAVGTLTITYDFVAKFQGF